MNQSDFYRRKLPHWQPAGAEYFITFRLKGSLPRSVIKQLKQEQQNRDDSESTNTYLRTFRQLKHQKLSKKYEEALDSGGIGPVWLANPKVASIVTEALHYRDLKVYDLYAFCIMSNHVHVVIKLLNNGDVKFPITDIFKKLKSYTALKANKVLERSGSFWQGESYDHVIQNRKELRNTIKYVLNNPVKANLISNWKEWTFSYCKPLFLDDSM